MNAAQLVLAVTVGIFALQADAGEQQKTDPLPAQAIAKSEESTELQEIRWLISESCTKNAECANRAAPGFNTSGSLRPMAHPGKPPSTPERRRALGLLDDSTAPRQ